MLSITMLSVDDVKVVEFTYLTTHGEITTKMPLDEAMQLSGAKAILSPLAAVMDVHDVTKVTADTTDWFLADKLFCDGITGSCPIHLYHRPGEIYYVDGIEWCGA